MYYLVFFLYVKNIDMLLNVFKGVDSLKVFGNLFYLYFYVLFV